MELKEFISETIKQIPTAQIYKLNDSAEMFSVPATMNKQQIIKYFVELLAKFPHSSGGQVCGSKLWVTAELLLFFSNQI